MRKTLLAVSVLLAFALDAAIMPWLGLSRFAPDALIALLVSLSVLTGLIPSVPIAAAAGLIFDIGFNRFIGMSSLPLLISSLAGSVFYSRFYADNPVIPGVTAAAAAFVKEHFLLIVLLLSGGRISGYPILFLTHILPASLLTGVLCAAIHLLFKRTLLRSSFRRDIDYLRQ